MEFVFTGAKDQKVPYFEDATPDIAPYYTSTKTPKRAQDEIRAEMAKLGAAIIAFDAWQKGIKALDNAVKSRVAAAAKTL